MVRIVETKDLATQAYDLYDHDLDGVAYEALPATECGFSIALAHYLPPTPVLRAEGGIEMEELD